MAHIGLLFPSPVVELPSIGVPRVDAACRIV